MHHAVDVFYAFLDRIGYMHPIHPAMVHMPIGLVVGAAAFLLLGATFGVAGGYSVVSLAIAAGIALLGGMAYAELASGRPDASGGAYVWVRSALPPPSGFLSGWLSWSGAMATASLSALGLGLFLMELVQPSADYFAATPPLAPVVGALVLAVAAASHVIRLHLSAKSLARLTLVKLVLIVALLAIGLEAIVPGASSGFPSASVAPAGLMGVVLGAGIADGRARAGLSGATRVANPARAAGPPTRWPARRAAALS